jgi:tRNA (guanosine-2'-O-)-methyltransferase
VVELVASPGVVVRRACAPSGPETCFDARDDNCNGIIDEGCGVRTGIVQFVIAWNKPAADVDLDVTDPGGELAGVGRPTQSGLVKERDCPGTGSDCQGQNLENVYLEDGDAPRGKYRVRVRLEKLGGENPPVLVTLGARVGPKTYALEFELSAIEEERELTIEL